MKSEDKLNKALEFKNRVSHLHQMLMNGQFEMDEDNKPPAFQLYVQDFLVGCMQMTGKEIGAYILLLCFQWDKNGLENDPEELKGIGKCEQETINKIIKKFRTCADGKLRNRRLEKIRAEQIANREQKSKAGILGNEARWKKPQKESVIVKELAPEIISNNDDDTIRANRYKAFSEEAKESQIWLESICMKSKKTPEQIKQLLNDFIPLLISTGENHLSISEFKKHFTYWIEKKPYKSSYSGKSEQTIKASITKRVDTSK